MEEDLLREDILNLFMDEFPGIMKTIDTDDEGIYFILGMFGAYLTKGILKNTIPENTLGRIFKILNLMGQTRRDLEVHNLLAVCIFEKVTDEKQCIAPVRKRLTGNALILFEKTVSAWGIDENS